MTGIVKTMKLHLKPSEEDVKAFEEITCVYKDACNEVSAYVFNNGFELNSNKLQKELYYDIREKYGLKAQFAVSVFKTVTARYKTVQEQLQLHPYKCVYEEDGVKKTLTFPRNLEWLMKPVFFSRPQADFVRNRDYSFLDGFKTLSINTMGKRRKVDFDLPDCFRDYFDGKWKFGTGKLVNLLGEWYLHIPMTKEVEEELDPDAPTHVVGIDRGLRFLVTAYDEKGKTTFISGKEILEKRECFAKTRAELQAKGTKSAKRTLKRISGRENRWMSDVNHQISKTLVREYGAGTLFVLEDLTSVSFAEENLKRGKDQKRNLRSWAFYELEQDLTYKAWETGSDVMKVSPEYTSQRCPKCGRIHKANRKHDSHEYICDRCGYRSNDDRTAAMNIQFLGTLYVSGDNHPRFGPRKEN